MDKTTLIGFLGFWGLVAFAILLGSGFGAYIDIPSVIIVFGGTIAVTVGQFEASALKNVSKSLKVAFNELKIETLPELVEKSIHYATEIKKNGVMSIEQKIVSEENIFFKEAFSLLVDNTKPELLEELMEMKLEQIENRHKVQISIYGNIGGTAGSMGMIGTLVGLVAMLANLADPSSVGPAMAVALLTTMYGALIGTGIAGLIESKLEQKHNVEMIAHQITIQAAKMIAAGESIGNIKMKLQAVLPQQEE